MILVALRADTFQDEQLTPSKTEYDRAKKHTQKKVNTRKHCSSSQPAEGDKDQHVCVAQDLGSKFKYQINNSRTRKRKIPASSDLQGTARKLINLHELVAKKFRFFLF